MEDKRHNPRHKVKIYSDEEIELFLSGDRREVDRLMLTSINNLASIFVPHAEREEVIFNAMGDVKTIAERAAWLDAQMRIAEKKEAFWDKAKSSVVSWGLIGIVGWIAMTVWKSFLQGPHQ